MILAPPGGYPPLDMVAGRYEPESTKLFEQLAKPGTSVIDIGAHVGYYSLLAARRIGSEGKVFAFEPEPMNYELLTKNAALNGYANIKGVNKAVSDQVGANTLYLSKLDNGRHTLFQQDTTQSEGTTVETTTIDAFLESEGWPDIGLIKIDVEGAELSVLNGMSRLLAKNRSLNMIIELNPALLRNAAVDPLDFLNRLKQQGFKVYVIDESGGPQELSETSVPALIDRLITADNSVNLHFAR